MMEVETFQVELIKQSKTWTIFTFPIKSILVNDKVWKKKSAIH